MKKFLFFFLLLTGTMVSQAYDFSAVAPTGQTLYYNISGTTVEVTYSGFFDDDNNRYYHYGDIDPSGVLEIPASVTYNDTTYSVTSIGNYAFSFCSGLTVVTVPNSVTSIGDCAFSSALTSITIGNSVTTIGEYAFWSCSNLTSLIIPNSVTSIGDYAFYACSGLTSVTIGNSVTSIGTYAFAYCSSLPSVTIPNSVTSIGRSAFSYCNGLTSVTIGNSVDSIGELAFYNCTGLPSVNIPNSVTNIGDYAFCNCSGLTNATIGNSVTNIGDYAFCNCSGLTSVTIGNSVTSIGESAFYNCISLIEITSLATIAPNIVSSTFTGVRQIPIYIPCGSFISYISGWSYFSNFIEGSGFNLTTSSDDNAMGVVSVFTQPTCTNPQAVVYAAHSSGYQFDHWSNGVTENPYSLTLTSDTSLTAFFVLREYDTIYIHDTIIEQLTYYTISVVSGNNNRGLVAGNGTFPEDTEVEIAAIPIQGNMFVQWTDGNTENPRLVTVNGNTNYEATFEANSVGVTEVEGVNFTIDTENGAIVVKDAPEMQIRIFDNLGRCLITNKGSELVRMFNMPATGAYMVQVGNYPAQKVVVVK